MGIVVLGEEFVFKLCHVDVARALAFATLTLQTKVENIVQVVAGEFRCWQIARNHPAQCIGPTSRAVLFLACHLIRGAHRAPIELATKAVAVAHLNVRCHAPFT